MNIWQFYDFCVVRVDLRSFVSLFDEHINVTGNSKLFITSSTTVKNQAIRRGRAESTTPLGTEGAKTRALTAFKQNLKANCST